MDGSFSDAVPVVTGVSPIYLRPAIRNLNRNKDTTLYGWLPDLLSHLQLTGPSHTSTWPWPSDPLSLVMEDAIQCCKVQGYEDYNGHQVSLLLPHRWTDRPRGTETYLGVTLSCDLTWSKDIQAVAIKANWMVDFAWRKPRGSPKCCKCMAYITLIRSCMEYASTIMGPVPEERHWSPREGPMKSSAMGLLGHHQCGQTPQRYKLDTLGRPKTEPKTSRNS